MHRMEGGGKDILCSAQNAEHLLTHLISKTVNENIIGAPKIQ